ncbi:hypothetical protein LTR91_009830 [Friedmanniomyces endolithicus]|uniref:HPP transmembrane region domain-containing protein n=1 Tax=Friedmanniomyces endolithicus TaxID=329885 RepID=A0AAN6KKL9_9PEZI|nr:hypothetical protein LTR94_005137 [Friedmanniomyces endolithicus]KAK0799629.1 hypothetical protein LTR59_005998 [Friedmanniomyces endolithicus]KAK0800194.1 hypothetical protein LTR75_008988 [Friedmanniomyces endolithicus]KAK0805295.1 hypothetical protein LTR38_005503 [Friedmanniomyces endolithicus]KAK0848170.1 hypothetical protein LTR03_005853 [Friedmanniomyces endolithicus]
MDGSYLHELLNFDLDRYLNPYIARSRVHAFPQPFRHFLGYRSKSHIEPPAVVKWPLTFISTLAGLCLVAGVFNYGSAIAALHPPVLIASFGASAILEYNTIRSPLAQPRNIIVGHALSAVVGVGVSKLFQLNPTFFANYSWVSAAVGCACASVVMSMTNTVHPPGGATAVLASAETTVVHLGWIFVPLIILASALMTTVACLFNNTLRQYPVCWWTPEDVGSKLGKEVQKDGKRDPNELERQVSETDSERTLRHAHSRSVGEADALGVHEVRILPNKMQLPSGLGITEGEMAVLQTLQYRLRMCNEGSA